MTQEKLRAYIEDRCVPEPNTGCWLWTNGTDAYGYGQASLRRICRKAHRLSYTSFIGVIPDGLSVLHRCDVPSCVNPDHLFIGTTADNMRDMHRKGRGIYGEVYKNAVLSSSDVSSMRQRRLNGERVGKLAAEYGVTAVYAGRIFSRKAWRREP